MNLTVKPIDLKRSRAAVVRNTRPGNPNNYCSICLLATAIRRQTGKKTAWVGISEARIGRARYRLRDDALKLRMAFDGTGVIPTLPRTITLTKMLY